MEENPAINLDSKCTYPRGCHQTINKDHSDSLCVFHCTREDKGVTEAQYQALLESRISEGDLDFRGYVFPWTVHFGLYPEIANEAKPTNLNFAVFEGNAIFDGIQFRSVLFNATEFHGFASFQRTTFEKEIEFNATRFLGGATFDDAEFRGKRTTFNRATIRGDICSFLRTRFVGTVRFASMQFRLQNRLTFSEATFENDVVFAVVLIAARSTEFSKANFKKRITFSEVNFVLSPPRFSFVQFEADTNFFLVAFRRGAYFANCRFLGQNVDFNSVSVRETVQLLNTRFAGKIAFDKTFVLGSLDIGATYFEKDASFSFRRPVELKLPDHRLPIQFTRTIRFSETIFNATVTKFLVITWDPMSKLRVSFDQCVMSGVRFIGCSMRAVYFRGTPIQDVNFINSAWGLDPRQFMRIPFTRKGLLGAELDLNDDQKKNHAVYGPLADQYRQLKVALDHDHDYENAGHAYYNMCEMKRLEAKFVGKNQIFRRLGGNLTRRKMQGYRMSSIDFFFKELPSWFNGKIQSGAYQFYKLLAGYGEKPHWSIMWLLFFVIAISGLNLRLGIIERLDAKHQRIIGYNFGTSLPDWGDFIRAVAFTGEHMNPVKLFGDKESVFVGTSDVTAILIRFVANTLLYVVLTFSLIGLQRRFKRF
ncbi:MAG: pentapeptide repeat-containing protein [Bacteroidota bacterium]|nr:pentapeptide repeat-containing protein [Bacteroidota bacterium]MDP4234324.1 pentapeptide repeat-containing protein [Bacteroidota bacterium]MDP4243258.1 pentapeptide repeat-containing protein [Bacteroidota bacterium]MDP4288035.1 pentapeptide repeat-containing protein [Bacteroidota bacterium]